MYIKAIFSDKFILPDIHVPEYSSFCWKFALFVYLLKLVFSLFSVQSVQPSILIYLFIHTHVPESVYLHIHLSIYMCIYPIYLSIHPSIHPFIHYTPLSIFPFISFIQPYIFPSICPSFNLSFYTSIHLHVSFHSSMHSSNHLYFP